MAVAIARIVAMLGSRLGNISKILRSNTLFVSASSKLKSNVIFNKNDIKNFVKEKVEEKKDSYINNLKKKLFSNLNTHDFIFFSEEELRRYVSSVDSNAEILKIMEFSEVDLYAVKFSDLGAILKTDDNGHTNIFLDAIGVGFASAYVNFLNYFLMSMTTNINLASNDIINKLTYLTDDNNNNNDIIDYIEDERQLLVNEVSNIITQRKNEDINNTYCSSCSCGCSCTCDEGSCGCSCTCNCNLTHYTQSWTDAKNDIINSINTRIDNIKDNINYNLLDENNQNSLKNYIMDRLVRNNNISLLSSYFHLMGNFIFNMKNKAKHTLLFAVLKENDLLKENEENNRKTGIMKTVYSVIKEYKGKKIECDKLIKNIQKELEKNGWKRNKQQIQQYISKISKNNIKIIRIDDYYIISGGKNVSK